MLEIMVYPQGFSEPSASPFAVKAMCLMEHSGQKYTVKRLPDPRKSPKGKLPVLRHNDKTIPDSDQIRDYMEQSFDIDYDAGLTPMERGQSRSIIRMVEEHLYFVIVASRWQTEPHWPIIREEYFGKMPKLLRLIIPNMIRKGVIKQLIGQGMGRHSLGEQLDRANKDIAAIEAILGDKTFLFGDKPSAADFSVVPMLRSILVFPLENELGKLVTSRPVLVAYLERGKATLYPK
jgi:glutathione S-transferase